MWPDVVVVVSPEGQPAVGIGEAVEGLLVEAFVAQAAVEVLDAAVLLRLARVDVAPFDAVLVGPLQDRLGGELGAVVTDDTGRFAVDAHQSVQFARHPGPRDAGIGNQGKVPGPSRHDQQRLAQIVLFESLCNPANGTGH